MTEREVAHTLLNPVIYAEEKSFEQSLRPQTLSQYIGQQKVKDNIVLRDWAKQLWQPSSPMK
jgi:Holliday junction resolvasome RuvABC ATP-dependent DNA helicase subunit